MAFAETAGTATPPSTREVFLFAVVHAGQNVIAVATEIEQWKHKMFC